MIDYEELFNLSYWRVTSNKLGGVSFVDAFLDALSRSSDEVARKLAGTNLEGFRSGLTLAIVYLASYYAKGTLTSSCKESRSAKAGRDATSSRTCTSTFLRLFCKPSSGTTRNTTARSGTRGRPCFAPASTT
jgi:hypothetical protein